MEYNFTSFYPDTMKIGEIGIITATLNHVFKHKITSKTLLFVSSEGGDLGEVLSMQKTALGYEFSLLPGNDLKPGNYSIILDIETDEGDIDRIESATFFTIKPKETPQHETVVRTITPNSIESSKTENKLFILRGSNLNNIDLTRGIGLVPRPPGFTTNRFRFIAGGTETSVSARCFDKIPEGNYQLKIPTKKGYILCNQRLSVE